MKNHLLLLLALSLSAGAAAQTASHVRKVDREDSYLFRVHYTQGKSSDLVACANEVLGNNINIRMRGDLSLDIAPEANFRIVTKDRMMKIEHTAADPETRAEVRKTVAKFEECLHLPETHTPPPTDRI